MLIALHARRSHASIVRFHHKHPELPLILALTGTDLYGDFHTDAAAQASLEMANASFCCSPQALKNFRNICATKRG